MALFKTFGMQKGDMLIFFLRPFRKVRIRKMQFLKDGVQTVGEHKHLTPNHEVLGSNPSGAGCKYS